jgi:hypothetical protein
VRSRPTYRRGFPDWFAFKGKYTTGAPSRKKEAPRYTQVGNAVFPALEQLNLLVSSRCGFHVGVRRGSCPPRSLAHRLAIRIGKSDVSRLTSWSPFPVPHSGNG